ncbi:hypothetical protein L1987_47690 [Smallanthus sonchifolius]|uniref:Uncharacterized protein n=1 Tax=Smallanthus sonchifolius TaxID=185202 RepID=A0ACB9G337_9ASTR|nr:hypothetical protein L1987_47690 [Smallanthus sonchifolius]
MLESTERCRESSRSCQLMVTKFVWVSSINVWAFIIYSQFSALSTIISFSFLFFFFEKRLALLQRGCFFIVLLCVEL